MSAVPAPHPLVQWVNLLRVPRLGYLCPSIPRVRLRLAVGATNPIQQPTKRFLSIVSARRAEFRVFHQSDGRLKGHSKGRRQGTGKAERRDQTRPKGP